MGGWMDARREGWMDGWLGGWMDGWVYGWMDGCVMAVCTYVCMYAPTLQLYLLHDCIYVSDAQSMHAWSCVCVYTHVRTHACISDVASYTAGRLQSVANTLCCVKLRDYHAQETGSLPMSACVRMYRKTSVLLTIERGAYGASCQLV